MNKIHMLFRLLFVLTIGKQFSYFKVFIELNKWNLFLVVDSISGDDFSKIVSEETSHVSEQKNTFEKGLMNIKSGKLLINICIININ